MIGTRNVGGGGKKGRTTEEEVVLSNKNIIKSRGVGDIDGWGVGWMGKESRGVGGRSDDINGGEQAGVGIVSGSGSGRSGSVSGSGSGTASGSGSGSASARS